MVDVIWLVYLGISPFIFIILLVYKLGGPQEARAAVGDQLGLEGIAVGPALGDLPEQLIKVADLLLEQAGLLHERHDAVAMGGAER